MFERGEMELQEGVNLHFIESSKFTTNRIRVRFVAKNE